MSNIDRDMIALRAQARLVAEQFDALVALEPRAAVLLEAELAGNLMEGPLDSFKRTFGQAARNIATGTLNATRRLGIMASRLEKKLRNKPAPPNFRAEFDKLSRDLIQRFPALKKDMATLRKVAQRNGQEKFVLALLRTAKRMPNGPGGLAGASELLKLTMGAIDPKLAPPPDKVATASKPASTEPDKHGTPDTGRVEPSLKNAAPAQTTAREPMAKLSQPGAPKAVPPAAPQGRAQPAQNNAASTAQQPTEQPAQQPSATSQEPAGNAPKTGVKSASIDDSLRNRMNNMLGKLANKALSNVGSTPAQIRLQQQRVKDEIWKEWLRWSMNRDLKATPTNVVSFVRDVFGDAQAKITQDYLNGEFDANGRRSAPAGGEPEEAQDANAEPASANPPAQPQQPAEQPTEQPAQQPAAETPEFSGQGLLKSLKQNVMVSNPDVRKVMDLIHQCSQVANKPQGQRFTAEFLNVMRQLLAKREPPLAPGVVSLLRKAYQRIGNEAAAKQGKPAPAQAPQPAPEPPQNAAQAPSATPAPAAPGTVANQAQAQSTGQQAPSPQSAPQPAPQAAAEPAQAAPQPAQKPAPKAGPSRERLQQEQAIMSEIDSELSAKNGRINADKITGLLTKFAGSVEGDPAGWQRFADGLKTIIQRHKGLTTGKGAFRWFQSALQKAEENAAKPPAQTPAQTPAQPQAQPQAEQTPAQSPADQETYDKAVAAVRKHSQVNAAVLQRELKLGYNACVKLIQQMQQNGVVSAPNQQGVRSVLNGPTPMAAESIRHGDRQIVAETIRTVLTRYPHLCETNGDDRKRFARMIHMIVENDVRTGSGMEAVYTRHFLMERSDLVARSAMDTMFLKLAKALLASGMVPQNAPSSRPNNAPQSSSKPARNGLPDERRVAYGNIDPQRIDYILRQTRTPPYVIQRLLTFAKDHKTKIDLFKALKKDSEFHLPMAASKALLDYLEDAHA